MVLALFSSRGKVWPFTYNPGCTTSKKLSLSINKGKFDLEKRLHMSQHSPVWPREDQSLDFQVKSFVSSDQSLFLKCYTNSPRRCSGRRGANSPARLWCAQPATMVSVPRYPQRCSTACSLSGNHNSNQTWGLLIRREIMPGIVNLATTHARSWWGHGT